VSGGIQQNLQSDWSLERAEFSVHYCDPTLSVLAMLVSRNIFHVVSALQSIVCLRNFLIQSATAGGIRRVDLFS